MPLICFESVPYVEELRVDENRQRQAILLSDVASGVMLPLVTLVAASPVIWAASEGHCPCSDVYVSLPDFPHTVLELMVDLVCGREVFASRDELDRLGELFAALGIDYVFPVNEAVMLPLKEEIILPDVGDETVTREVSPMKEGRILPDVAEEAVTRLKKKHHCEVCNKRFSTRSKVNAHMMVHSNLKPFECEVCHRTFSWKNGLRRHALTHAEEKPFQCDICPKRFTQKSNKKLHMLIHKGLKPFECKTCGACFTQKSNLNRHVYAHEGMRPHTCEVCGKAFRDRGTLREHSLAHTDERNFPCDICSMAFKSKRQLTKHVTARHST